MQYKLAAPPAPVALWTKTATTPIDGPILATIKTWINRPLEDVFWDSEAATLFTVAQRVIEKWCEMAIAPATWVGTMPFLPPSFRIIKRPFLTVTAISVVDPDTGAVTALDPATYLAMPASQMCGHVQLADGQTWPALAKRPDAVRITVTTGWPLGADDNPVLPDELTHALAVVVAYLDANRGDSGGGGAGRLANTVWGQTHPTGASALPAEAQALLSPLKYMGLYVA